nr:MAG TPA: hypothetical protein [Caudoviricetes sp.]
MENNEILLESDAIDYEADRARAIEGYLEDAKDRLAAADEDDEVAVAVAQEAARNVFTYLGIETNIFNYENYSTGMRYTVTLEGLGEATEAIGGAIKAVWDAIMGAISAVFNWFAGLFGSFEAKNKAMLEKISSHTDEDKAAIGETLEKIKEYVSTIRKTGADKLKADKKDIPANGIELADFYVGMDSGHYSGGLDTINGIITQLVGNYNTYKAIANGKAGVDALKKAVTTTFFGNQVPQPYNAPLIGNYITQTLKVQPADVLCGITHVTGKGVGVCFVYPLDTATGNTESTSWTPTVAKNEYLSTFGMTYSFEDGPGTTVPDNTTTPAQPAAQPAEQPQEEQQEQPAAPAFQALMGSAYFEFDSVGPVSATSEELTKYEWSYDLLVEHVRKLGDLDKEYKKLSDRTKKISEDLDKKIKGTSPKMEDKYINTTIVKGVGAALKAFAIEVPNMVTRRRVVIEKIINGTYTVPGTQNGTEAPKTDAKQPTPAKQPAPAKKQPAPKPATKPAPAPKTPAAPKPSQPGTGDNNPQNGAGRNNQ